MIVRQIENAEVKKRRLHEKTKKEANGLEEALGTCRSWGFCGSAQRPADSTNSPSAWTRGTCPHAPKAGGGFPSCDQKPKAEKIV
jgi:hypothetical protein